MCEQEHLLREERWFLLLNVLWLQGGWKFLIGQFRIIFIPVKFNAWAGKGQTKEKESKKQAEPWTG